MKSFYAFENGAVVRADAERYSIVMFISPDRLVGIPYSRSAVDVP
jgi:hypothetical protein